MYLTYIHTYKCDEYTHTDLNKDVGLRAQLSKQAQGEILTHKYAYTHHYTNVSRHARTAETLSIFRDVNVFVALHINVWTVCSRNAAYQ
jgi:hypothetical protein